MDNLKLPFEIAELIFRHMRKENSEEDDLKLHQWLDEDTQNKTLYYSITNEETIKKKLKQYDSYDKQKAWKSVSKELQLSGNVRKRQIQRIISYAAAVIIPLLVGSYFLFNSDLFKNDEMITEHVEILPGSQKAILILANGEQVKLDNSATGTVYSDQEINIVNSNHTLKYLSDNRSFEDLQMPIVYNTLTTPKGGEYSLVLSDGTKVWLNADSKLTYPTYFSGDTRPVMVEGEAYFEVSKNENKPFIVRTKETEITVLGTVFNITAYTDENNNLTTLIEGKVKVKNLSESSSGITEIELLPGEQAFLNKEDRSMNSKKVNIEVYTAWRKGLFLFEYEALDNLMRRLGRWYDFETEFSSKDLKEYHFSGTIKRYDNFTDILDMIALTTNISFKKDGHKVIVSKKTK